MDPDSFDTRLHVPDEPDWRPLEAVARLSRATDDLPTIHEADFMYMAYVEAPSTGLRIHLYKHRETRRHLNLDDGGHAYRYCGQRDAHDFTNGGRYALLPTLADALHLVVDDLEWLRPSPEDRRARREGSGGGALRPVLGLGHDARDACDDRDAARRARRAPPRR